MKIQTKKNNFGREQLYVYIPREAANSLHLFDRVHIICSLVDKQLIIIQADKSPFKILINSCTVPMAALMIPPEFTEMLGWKKGDELDWKLEKGKLVLWRA
jgi:hypothetical protein